VKDLSDPDSAVEQRRGGLSALCLQFKIQHSKLKLSSVPADELGFSQHVAFDRGKKVLFRRAGF
jgi:hypothetical protein